MQGFAVLLLVLSGCGILQGARDKVDGIKDAISGLTNPLISQGIILGVQEPDDQRLAEMLDKSDFDSGTGISVFLADAASAGEAENAPVSGASVTVLGTDTMVADEDATGLYTIPPTPDSLPYVVDDAWEVQVAIQDVEEVSTIGVTLPPVATVVVPLEHAPLQLLELDFTGQAFDSAFIVVVDQGGVVTYTNEPTDISDVLAMTQSAEPITLVEIPAEAFPTEGAYAVGVAGMLHSEGADVENMNTLLSSLMAGKMRFYPTTVLPPLP